MGYLRLWRAGIILLMSNAGGDNGAFRGPYEEFVNALIGMEYDSPLKEAVGGQ